MNDFMQLIEEDALEPEDVERELAANFSADQLQGLKSEEAGVSFVLPGTTDTLFELERDIRAALEVLFNLENYVKEIGSAELADSWKMAMYNCHLILQVPLQSVAHFTLIKRIQDSLSSSIEIAQKLSPVRINLSAFINGALAQRAALSTCEFKLSKIGKAKYSTFIFEVAGPVEMVDEFQKLFADFATQAALRYADDVKKYGFVTESDPIVAKADEEDPVGERLLSNPATFTK